MIYFVQAQTTRLVKIGWTEQAQGKRLMAIRQNNADHISVLLIIPGNKSHETCIHDLFIGYRHHGEWFRPGKLLREFIDQTKRLFSPDGTGRQMQFEDTKRAIEYERERRAQIAEAVRLIKHAAPSSMSAQFETMVNVYLESDWQKFCDPLHKRFNVWQFNPDEAAMLGIPIDAGESS